MQLTAIQCPLYIILYYGPIFKALCLTRWLKASAIILSYGHSICPLYIHFGYGLLLIWHIASLLRTPYASCRLLLTLPSSSYALALKPNAPPSLTQWLLLKDLPCCSHPPCTAANFTFHRFPLDAQPSFVSSCGQKSFVMIGPTTLWLATQASRPFLLPLSPGFCHQSICPAAEWPFAPG